MNEDDITIPEPVYMKWPQFYTCVDSPTPAIKIQYEGQPNLLQSHRFPAIMILTNQTSLTIPACDYAKIYFPILVTTSLPAVSILYGEDFLFRHNLTCLIDPIPTNNTFLYITVYNHKSEPVTFAKESLQFHCHTVLGNCS